MTLEIFKVFTPDRGPSQRSASQNVDTLVPDGRGPSSYGGSHVSPPGRSSRARRGAHVRAGGVQGSVSGHRSTARGQAAVSWRRVDDEELEARLDAEYDELSAMGYARLSVRQKILQELSEICKRWS